MAKIYFNMIKAGKLTLEDINPNSPWRNEIIRLLVEAGLYNPENEIDLVDDLDLDM